MTKHALDKKKMILTMATLYYKQMILCTTIVFAEVHLHLVRRWRRHSEFKNLTQLKFNSKKFQTEDEPGCFCGFLDRFLSWPFDFDHELIPPGWHLASLHIIQMNQKTTSFVDIYEKVWGQGSFESLQLLCLPQIPASSTQCSAATAMISKIL